MDIVRKAKTDLKLWSEQGSLHNFQQKMYLMEAEERFCLGDFSNARVSYNKAIVASQVHRFVNDEAMAHECAAKFYFEARNLSLSLEHFKSACEKYQQWGAAAKAKQLHSFVKRKFLGILN